MDQIKIFQYTIIIIFLLFGYSFIIYPKESIETSKRVLSNLKEFFKKIKNNKKKINKEEI